MTKDLLILWKRIYIKRRSCEEDYPAVIIVVELGTDVCWNSRIGRIG